MHHSQLFGVVIHGKNARASLLVRLISAGRRHRLPRPLACRSRQARLRQSRDRSGRGVGELEPLEEPLEPHGLAVDGLECLPLRFVQGTSHPTQEKSCIAAGDSDYATKIMRQNRTVRTNRW